MSKSKDILTLIGEMDSEEIMNDPENLQMYMDNTQKWYKEYYIPTVKHLLKILDKGTYETKLAARAFGRIIDAGIKMYEKEFGVRVFISKKDKDQLAIDYANDTKAKYEFGEFKWIK